MLLFCDSFDHYTSLTAKGWLVSGNTGITAGVGRYRDCAWARTTSVSGVGGDITQVFTNRSEVIVGGAIKFDDYRGFVWQFREGSTTHIAVTINASGLIEVRRGSGGTLLATGTTAISGASWTYIEAQVKVADTGGAITIRVNGASDIAFSGDTRNGGATGAINRFVHLAPYLGATVTSAYSYLDDLVILDTSGTKNNSLIGDMRVEALFPSGNGNSSQLVGADADSVDNYQQVDENPPDGDTTFVESSTVGDKDTYQYSDIASVASDPIAVVAQVYARRTDAGPRTVAAIVRSSGGTEQTGGDLALDSSYDYAVGSGIAWAVFETDPDGNPWTNASVNAAEFGVKVTL